VFLAELAKTRWIADVDEPERLIVLSNMQSSFAFAA